MSDSCLEISAIFQNPLTFVGFISAFDNDNDMRIASGFLLPSCAYRSPLFSVREKMSEFYMGNFVIVARVKEILVYPVMTGWSFCRQEFAHYVLSFFPFFHETTHNLAAGTRKYHFKSHWFIQHLCKENVFIILPKVYTMPMHSTTRNSGWVEPETNSAGLAPLCLAWKKRKSHVILMQWSM